MKYLVIITALLLCFSVSAKTNSSYMISGVKIEIQKENDCYYLLAAGKEKETLICVDDELQSDIIIKDFNFDGYKDIAISSSLGMVNTVFYVFLYDHINAAFKKL
ncbi:MAG: XAC2610-related protein, partial [Shewanella sp.]